MKPRRSPLVGKALVSSSYCDECEISPSSEDVAASTFHAFCILQLFTCMCGGLLTRTL